MSYSGQHRRLELEAAQRNLGAHFIALCGFLVFLPDTDGFMAQFQTFPSLCALAGGPLARFVGSFYPNLLSLGLVTVVAVGMLKRQLSKDPLFYLVCFVSAVALTWAFMLSLLNGLGLYQSLRQSYFAHLLIVFLGFVAAGQARDTAVMLRAFLLGAGLAQLLKLCYFAVCYRLFGGVEILPGVWTLQADGGNLATQAFLGSWAAAIAADALVQKRCRHAALAILCSAVFAAGVASSFRRLAVLELIGASVAGVLIASWLRGQLKQGLRIAAATTAAIAVAIAITAIGVFGLRGSAGRLASFSFSEDSDNSMGSGAGYVSQWAAWPRAVALAMPLGIGFEQDYGVARLADRSHAGEYVPLHTGPFELWASLGVLGAGFHFVVLLAPPLLGLARIRRLRSNATDVPLFSVAVAFTLFTGLFPFSAPPYGNPEFAVVIGLALGYIVNASGGWHRALVFPRRGALPLAAGPAPRFGLTATRFRVGPRPRRLCPALRASRPYSNTASKVQAKAGWGQSKSF